MKCQMLNVYISAGKERNFYKAKTINYNIPYDYNSVMQYRK